MPRIMSVPAPGAWQSTMSSRRSITTPTSARIPGARSSFAGPSYGCILEELKARGKKSEGKLIRYSEAYRELHYPIHLLSCDETGARQLQIMAVPYYRESWRGSCFAPAYQPPPEDAPAWDALYNGLPL